MPSVTKGFQSYLLEVLQELGDFLIEKNTSYGDSACNPINAFSKLNALERIDVRIDDKIQRIINGTEYPGDDTELDLLGYLILKRVVKKRMVQPREDPIEYCCQ